MFVRHKKNTSGSTSIQIISKERGRYQVVKTIGSAKSEQEIAVLKEKARQEIQAIQCQQNLFIFEQDALIESFVSQLRNGQIRTVGPELVFGKVFDYVGYKSIKENLFRHLVIARLTSKIKK